MSACSTRTNNLTYIMPRVTQHKHVAHYCLKRKIYNSKSNLLRLTCFDVISRVKMPDRTSITFGDFIFCMVDIIIISNLMPDREDRASFDHFF